MERRCATCMMTVSPSIRQTDTGRAIRPPPTIDQQSFSMAHQCRPKIALPDEQVSVFTK